MEKQIQIQKWIQSNWPKWRYAFHFMRRPPWCLLRFDVVSSGMLPWPFDEFGGHKLVVTWLFFLCVLLWLHMFLLGDDLSNHSQNLPFPSTVYLEVWVPAHYNFPRSKFLDICRHSRTISKHFFLSTTIGQYVLVAVGCWFMLNVFPNLLHNIVIHNTQQRFWVRLQKLYIRQKEMVQTKIVGAFSVNRIDTINFSSS